MANKRSISTTFLFNLLLVTIISIGLLGCLWTWQQYVNFERESTQLREMMLNNYRNLLKTQVQRSVDYIEYRKSLTEARLRDSIQERVNEAYDIAVNHYETCKGCKSPQDVQSTIKDGYVFIAQWDGLSLTGPAKGRNMLGVTDPNGVKIVQELIALAKSSGGFLSYVMPRFKGMKPDPKLSYVQGIKDWQWYVGAGIYIDDIETAIATKHAEMTGEMVKSFIQIAAVLLGLTLFAVFWARRVAHNVRISFDRFTIFFDKGARESAVIDPGGMRYEEFEHLAHAANQMIEARIVAQDALQENKEWLQSILDSIQAGMVVIDPQTHTIIELNQAAVEMIGTTKDRLIDTICHNHICPDEIGACPVTDRGLSVEQSDRVLLTADGTRMPILKTVNRIQ